MSTLGLPERKQLFLAFWIEQVLGDVDSFALK